MRLSSLAFLLLLVVPGWAGDYSAGAKGTTTANFLKLGAGARSAAMGEAYSAVAEDATALYWNPAALTRLQARSATLMHAAYLDASAYQYAAYGQRLGGGSVGLGLQYFSPGSLKGADAAGVETGDFRPSDLALTAGYAREFNGVSAGIGLKFIRSKIQRTAQTAAVDLGLLSPPLTQQRLRLALTAANLFGRLKFEQVKEDLPSAFRLGASWSDPRDWTASADLVAPRDNRRYAALGVEFRRGLAAWELALRAGYNTRSAGDLEGLAGASLGFGIGLENAEVDYAIVPFGDLGLTHRASLTLRFGGADAEAAVEVALPPQLLAETAPVGVQDAPTDSPELDAVSARYAALLRSAEIKTAGGDFDGARAELISALAVLPRGDVRHLTAFERLGQVAERDQQIQQAKLAYLSAIRFAKRNSLNEELTAKAYAGLAQCLSLQGQRRLAIRNFKKARLLTADEAARQAISKRLLELKAR